MVIYGNFYGFSMVIYGDFYGYLLVIYCHLWLFPFCWLLLHCCWLLLLLIVKHQQ